MSSIERNKEDVSSRSKGSMCGNTTRGTAKGKSIEKKSGIYLMTEGTGALQ